MSLKDKCRLLGLGNYGGKQVEELVSLNYKGTAVNGSEQDLKVLGDINKYQLHGFDGFGGNRERALDCLDQNPDFLRSVKNIEEKIIFLFFSGGGSFGSGCAPILADMLAKDICADGSPKKIVCPVIALPSSDESFQKHRNAYETVKEFQEIAESGTTLGATFFINNNASITNGTDKETDYVYINGTFTKFIDTFLSNDTYGKLNNFDESERLEMLKNSGMMIMNLTNMAEKNQTLDQVSMVQTLTRDGIFAPIENNKVCENIAIIHAGQGNTDITKDIIISEVGKPKNIFEGYNGKNTFIAVSGLNYPISHMSSFGESIKATYKERQRNKMQTRKLDDLDITENERPKTVVQKERKPTKWEILQKKMNQ